MLKIYTADEGYLYQNKTNGMMSKTLILGVNDSIDNYEVVPEPVEAEEIEEVVEVEEDV